MKNGKHKSGALTLTEAIDRLEREMIAQALESGDERKAAEQLGISSATLQHYIDKHNLRKPDSKVCPVCALTANSFLPDAGVNLKEKMEAIEKEIVREALAKCGGNKAKTARFLQIEYHAINYLVEKHGF